MPTEMAFDVAAEQLLEVVTLKKKLARGDGRIGVELTETLVPAAMLHELWR